MREARLKREKEQGAKARKPQEPAPVLFPDLLWIWSAFCFLSDRRGVSANGPVPITIEAMHAYAKMSNRFRQPYVEQMLRFIPALDRFYLHDFYEKQRKEMEKQRKKAEAGARKGAPGNRRGGIGRR